MRKFGIKYSQLHPLHAEVRADFGTVKAAGGWRDVLAKWYNVDGPGVHRYASPNFTRGVTTTGPISPPIPVEQVTDLYISYKDTLSGNFYVTSYTRD